MIRVILADDHPVVLEGLTQLVNGSGDMQVVSRGTTVQETMTAIENNPADVLVLDLSLPGGGGFEVLKRLTDLPDMPLVLVLSVQPEEMYGLRCLDAGASGFLNKEADADLIRQAIRTVSHGRTFLSQELQRSREETWAKKNRIERLSSRELEIMRLLVQGHRNRDIAVELKVSEKTISEHRRRLLEKLGVDNVPDLVRIAQQEGLESF